MTSKLLTLSRAGSAIVIAAGLSVLLASCAPTNAGLGERAATVIPITIDSTVPAELNPAGGPYGNGGGAPTATLDQAAAFAWQEFIALNWPAMTHTTETPLRDTPDPGCAFGATTGRCGSRPLVWQTFRGKAEVYSPITAANYNDPSDYLGIYTSGDIPACPGFIAGPQPAWVNLDESDEIGLAAMYAGISTPAPPSNAYNSDPNLIRFMAKANQTEFDYVRQINANSNIPSALQSLTQASVLQNGSPPPGSTNLVSFPSNTIEVKAGWRQLGATEDPGRFHTARVRYYETYQPTPGSPPAQCFLEATWALVALHIIQKTATAPYFIFATFEQADNILTPGGQPTEDLDGNVIVPQSPPTTPVTTYQDNSSPVGPQGNPPAGPPNVSLSPPYCAPQSQLFFINVSTRTALPTRGPICLNARDHPISPVVIAANQRAHAAINAANPNSPWSYYRLTNVQYYPMNRFNADSTYYMANAVVESNTVLQNFSGGLVSSPNASASNGYRTGANSDFAVNFLPTTYPPTAGGDIHNNVFYLPPQAGTTFGYLMGGCMGCHGSAQTGGSDFSFILLFGAVPSPDMVPLRSATGVRHDTRRLDRLWRN